MYRFGTLLMRRDVRLLALLTPSACAFFVNPEPGQLLSGAGPTGERSVGRHSHGRKGHFHGVFAPRWLASARQR